MSVTVERAESKPATRRSVFILRFISTIALWTVALVICFSGYEFAFFALISIVGLIALWEFYGMLDYKGLPNFKLTGMICGAVMLTGSFYYFSHYGPARSYDFEVAVLLFFLLTVFTRQMFDSLRDDAPLQTMAYTLFGLLYVLWLFNFILKIVYVVPRSPTGDGDGTVLLSLSHRDHEIQRHGRVSHRQRNWPASTDSAHQSQKNMGRIFRRAGVLSFCQPGVVRSHARAFIGFELDTRDRAWPACLVLQPSSAIWRSRSSNAAPA